MSRNGWIACIVGAVVIIAACGVCFGVGLLGYAGYRYIAPTLSIIVPRLTFEPGSPIPSPLVIRPTNQVDLSTPTPLSTGMSPQLDLATPPSPMPEDIGSVTTETLKTLENTSIPIADPIEIARRLLHLDNLSPTEPPPAAYYQVGAQQSFWVGDGRSENFRVRATLRYVTEHSYFWIEDNISYSQRDLAKLADTFENKIYPTDRGFFGSEWTPGVDGDPHIYILYVRGVGQDIAGYFSSADEYPTAINRESNEHEMFVINADNSPLNDRYTYGVMAHEFQHMIHWYQDRNESGWVSEGFSELAALLNNDYSGGFDALYTSNTDLQLNDWPDESQASPLPHYGASFLFFAYFLDRFGESATKALVANQDNDLHSVDTTLQALHAVDSQTGKPITADSFFMDWAVTNYLMDPGIGDGRYTYTRYRGAAPAQPTETFRTCPVPATTRDVHQYGVDYIRFTCPGSYNLHFEGSVQTPLLPQDPHTGSYAMWANKSDESDTTLTRTFDLTTVKGSLTFSYWTWYAIENGWDYVYLEASTDGKNWQILNTPSGTASNPHGSNYGWGYTGFSGGGKYPAWLHESIDLSQYAGKNLTLRFEYLTDGDVTGEGFLLDDVSIPEIGYSTGFETDAGGWQVAGWARIRNILPQDFGLALITFGNTTSVKNITMNPDITADVPFTIGKDIKDVVLVVSGLTRFTRQLAPYRFTVTTP